jgi:hypothetical protein
LPGENNVKVQKIRIKYKSGSRGRVKTIEMGSMWGMKMLSIVCQFDRAYCKLKDRWGESGGIPGEEAMAIREDALDAMREFSDSMERFSEKVGVAYYPPKGFRNKRLIRKY